MLLELPLKFGNLKKDLLLPAALSVIPWRELSSGSTLLDILMGLFLIVKSFQYVCFGASSVRRSVINRVGTRYDRPVVLFWRKSCDEAYIARVWIPNRTFFGSEFFWFILF